MSTSRRLLTGWLAFHLLLVSAVCWRDAFGIFGRAGTVFPDSFQPAWRRAEALTSAGIGADLAASNPLRNGLTVYLHAAGVETGYGFFAPNVPDNYKLVLEFHYLDGRVEYDVPPVHSNAAGLRLAGLLDEIAETDLEPLRKGMIKILALAAWEQHPGATKVRAVLVRVILPTAKEFKSGAQQSYEVLHAYDLSSRTSSPEKVAH